MSTKSNWSQHVNETSDAMDIEGGLFKQKSPAKIARALEHDAEKSNRRKSTPYRSAMSMLTFYINRAGTNLSQAQRKVLEDAKTVLRDEFGPQKSAAAKKKTPAKKTPAKKTPAKKTPAKKTARKKSR